MTDVAITILYCLAFCEIILLVKIIFGEDDEQN